MVLPAESSQTAAQTTEESEELARFRAEWRAELARRKAATDAAKDKQAETSQDAGVSQGERTNRPQRPHFKQAGGGETSGAAGILSHPAIREGRVTTEAASAVLNSALGVYRRAVQHEQKGELDAALALYRQAFRRDPHVDRAYHREELLQTKIQVYKERAAAQPDSETGEPNKLVTELQHLSLKEDKQKHVSGALEKIIAAFPPDVTFEPEDEKSPVHLNVLPPELLYQILRNMDVPTLERFARVSRWARVLALDPVYWGKLVTKIYKPPQLIKADDLLAILEKNNSDFRRVFIEQPRVRTDGVYIATCHYVRPGLSEDAWMNTNHLVTYHRYLRFFPNGQVLSLLTNEQHGPQEVIPMLKPTLRMKGLFIGNWYLEGTTLNLVNLLDASGQYQLPDWDLLEVTPGASSSSSATPRPQPPTTTTTTNASNPATLAPAASRYIFDMVLELKSRPVGRWNKLEIRTYASIKLETGDVSPFPLKNERPFWFSKVRSYAHY